VLEKIPKDRNCVNKTKNDLRRYQRQ